MTCQYCNTSMSGDDVELSDDPLFDVICTELARHDISAGRRGFIAGRIIVAKRATLTTSNDLKDAAFEMLQLVDRRSFPATYDRLEAALNTSGGKSRG